MTEEKAPKPRLELVYAGRVTLKGGKIGQMFYDIKDAGTDKETVDEDSPRVYGKFKTVFMVVGGVHSMEYEPNSKEGSVFPSTVRFERMWGDQVEIDGWVARDRTLLAAKEADRLRTKMVSENDDVGRMLTRLHGMYLSLPVGPQKAAFITMIVNAVMRG